MITPDKYTLSKLLIGDRAVDSIPHEHFETFTQIIDDMAVLRPTGKPVGAKTFGDLAHCYIRQVFCQYSNTCDRTDVVFDL